MIEELFFVKLKDILLFYPYQTMDHFIDFLKEAARDPEVLSIKITLYRVAKNSEVIKYLLEDNSIIGLFSNISTVNWP